MHQAKIIEGRKEESYSVFSKKNFRKETKLMRKTFQSWKNAWISTFYKSDIVLIGANTI